MSDFLTGLLAMTIMVYPVVTMLFAMNDHPLLDSILWPILVLKRVKDIWNS